MCSSGTAVGADGLSDGELLDAIAAAVAARNREDARLARLVRAAEHRQAAEHDGLKSMRSWLPGHCRLPAAAAARIVGNGRVLEHLPALAEAHDAGLVSAEQVAVAATALTPERLQTAAEHGVDLSEIDAVLTGAAIEQRYADFVTVVRHYLARLDPDGPEPDPTEGRRLTLAKHADGSLSLRGELDAVGGEKLQAALESFVQADRPAGDERSRAQRLGDALVQLCDTALASGSLPVLRTVKPHVAVVIDLEDLADPATGPDAGRMGFGATISAARARWLACDATVSRVVFGPDGAPLDLGREHRLADRHLRRAVELRDGGCVFTGCAAPTWWAEVHHLVHWLDGGETTLANSALLCERHHTKVHHGFRVERQADGRWRTWRPDGTEIRTAPPLRQPAA
ncbi:HNH endonuclease signature motif containing protein [Geodermatophilus tzadiensis]|uniref:HNH endonuclease signature motif containing protein n=1 Tax=Geodermatophilus tzadiensis TaxID=1137988 RepID=UPI000D052BC8|nr:HNH endonuclease signature motif containing protein [Geodermatophilus tzadiensis]